MVCLKAYQRHTLPVVGLFFAVYHHNRMAGGRRVRVGGQDTVLPHKTVNAAAVEHLHLVDHLRLAGGIVDGHGIKPYGAVQIGVFVVCPERQHLVGGEVGKRQLALLVVVGIYPRFAACVGVFSHNADHALYLAGKHA